MEMDKDTARRLSELTGAFYEANAAAFAQTRQHAWRGWHVLADLVERERPQQLAVLDLACGNYRFERFLADALNDGELEIWAYDSSEAFLDTPFRATQATLHASKLDLVDGLLNGLVGSDGRFLAPPCDLAVCYGFMHHVPGFENRATLLDTLVEHTKPQGYIAVSYWQFMNDRRLSGKALATTKLARAELGPLNLEANDYLLGWKDTSGSYRYCHHFEKREIELLSQHIGTKARLVESFDADGKDNRLNHYCIWQRN